mgnify:CR=1 FL=1
MLKEMNPEHRDLENTDFVIMDLETTGLDPETGDRIIEIAAIKVRRGEKIAQLHYLVNPDRPLSLEAYQINQIDEGMIKDAPKSDQVLPEFLDFIRGSVLCIYNAGFDIGFLNKELSLINKKMQEDIPVLDVLVMARRLLPGIEGYSLKSVASHLGLKSTILHRALEDVEITHKIFQYLLDVLKKKGMDRLADIHNLFGYNSSMINLANARKSDSILQAIKLERRLKIKYFSRSGIEITEREIQPREIIKENGKDYLLGFCFLKSQERQFRIDAIIHLEIL